MSARQRLALGLVKLALRIKDTNGLRWAEEELLELIAEEPLEEVQSIEGPVKAEARKPA